MSLARYRTLLLLAKLLENESMRKEKWRPGGDDFGYEMDGKVNFRLCRLRTVPLLALMTED